MGWKVVLTQWEHERRGSRLWLWITEEELASGKRAIPQTKVRDDSVRSSREWRCVIEMLMERIMIQRDPCLPAQGPAIICQCSSVPPLPPVLLTDAEKVRPLLHAELTGSKAYHYGVIVQSYYCLQECSWQGFWPAFRPPIYISGQCWPSRSHWLCSQFHALLHMVFRKRSDKWRLSCQNAMYPLWKKTITCSIFKELHRWLHPLKF